jgi:hypothetical protein
VPVTRVIEIGLHFGNLRASQTEKSREVARQIANESFGDPMGR